MLAIYREAIPAAERKPDAAIRAMTTHVDYVVLPFARSGRIVGFAAVFAPADAPFALIEYLAAHRDSRSRGVGGAMIAAVIAALPGRPLLVEVEREGKMAERRKAFYRRHGWVDLRDIAYAMPQVGDDPPPPVDLMLRAATHGDPGDAPIDRWIERIHADAYGVPPSDIFGTLGRGTNRRVNGSPRYA